MSGTPRLRRTRRQPPVIKRFSRHTLRYTAGSGSDTESVFPQPQPKRAFGRRYPLHPDSEVAKYFPAFVHEDPAPWNFYEITKTAILAIFVLIPRMVVGTFFIAMACITCVLLCLNERPNCPDGVIHLRGWKRRFAQFMVSACARMALLVCGVFHIKVVRPPRGAAMGPGVPTPRTAPPAVISNHTSWMDVLALLAMGHYGFAAKADVRTAPLIGFVAQCIDVVFIDRTSKESRAEAAAELDRRCRGVPFIPNGVGSASESDGEGAGRRAGLWRRLMVALGRCEEDEDFEKEILLPLTIFPEACTTGGRHVISFRGGAFGPGQPLQPVIIRYPAKHTNAGWETEAYVKNFCRLCTDFCTHITIEYLPIYYPDAAQRAAPLQYARDMQEIYAERMGVPAIDCNFFDKFFLEDYLKDRVSFEECLANSAAMHAMNREQQAKRAPPPAEPVADTAHRSRR